MDIRPYCRTEGPRDPRDPPWSIQTPTNGPNLHGHRFHKGPALFESCIIMDQVTRPISEEGGRARDPAARDWRKPPVQRPPLGPPGGAPPPAPASPPLSAIIPRVCQTEDKNQVGGAKSECEDAAVVY
eukprot:scaffold14458_cov107-Isochrysis_galbana.AAC.4